MKKLFLIVFTACLFSACKEVPPAIDFSEPPVFAASITVSVPQPQHKMVLLEDITGVRCVNCPFAAIKAKEILTQKSKDSVVVIALYPTKEIIENFTAPFPGVPNLTSPLATQIVNTVGIPSGLPNGYVDRKLFSGKSDRVIGVSEWLSFVNIRLKEKTDVNIELSKTINDRNLTTQVKLTYTKALPNVNHKIAIYLTEDSIKSKQVTPSGLKDDYVHNHALRHSFLSPTGYTFKEPLVLGRTFEGKFNYEISMEYKIKNCHIICVVMNAATEEVINVREIDL